MPMREVELMEIRRTYFATEGRKARKQVVEDAAKRYGVSYSTINRKLDLGIRTESKPNPELMAKKNEINTWATQIFDFAQTNTKDEKRILIKRAFKVYQRYHGLPDHITLRNIYDAIEEMKLKNQSRHCPGHYRKGAPREMYHMDFTTSRYLKHIGNGILKITNERYTRKNTDEDGNKVRLWIGGVIDDHSNVIYYEYVLTLGESAIAAQDVILNAFRRKDGETVLQGLPQQIYLDRGPGFRDEGFRAGLEGIAVTVKFGDDIIDRRTGKRTNQTNKGAHGKIERMHEVVKNDFEQELLLGTLDGCDLKAGSHISLNELNPLIRKWCADYNMNTHPEYKGRNKWNLFAEDLSEEHFLPDDCKSFFARTSMRTVAQGRIQMGANKWYAVPETIDDRAKIEIITIGDMHYTMVNGQRVHLPPVSGIVGDAVKMVHPEAERKTDLITDEDTIRDRIDQELKKQTSGLITLQDLDTVLYVTMCKDFFDQPHTIEEIKSRAGYVAIRAKEQMREESIAMDQEVERTDRGHGVRDSGGAKIITMPSYAND
jgi:hypothetical protein